MKKYINLLIVLISGIIIAGCATGSSIITGEKRPPVDPSTVKLYLENPARYEVIGIVTASSDSGWTEQQSQNYAVKELKKQAAKLGANGVLITGTGEKSSTVVGGYGTGFFYGIPVTAKTISGKAIYVIK